MSSIRTGVMPTGTLPCWSYSWKRLRRCPTLSQPSTDQPDPWIDVALAVNWAWNFAKSPKNSAIAAASSPSGSPPPSGETGVQQLVVVEEPPRLVAWLYARGLGAGLSPG